MSALRERIALIADAAIRREIGAASAAAEILALLQSDEAVERVARELAGANWRSPPHNSIYADQLNVFWRQTARRAIRALLEDTP